MKHPIAVILTVLLLAASAPAATVFTNLGNPVTSSVLVKGTGGFIPTAIEYGFEFTAGVGDHELTSLSVSIGTHFGSLPLTVQLFDSPAGPDSATYLTDLTGPAQPANQVALYTPVMPVTLSGGGTYFVRFSVAGSASSYGIPTTNSAGSGTFTMGNSYQRNAGSLWGSGSALSGPLVAIEASAVPEPAGLVPSAAGFLLIVARRQRRRHCASMRRAVRACGSPCRYRCRPMCGSWPTSRRTSAACGASRRGAPASAPGARGPGAAASESAR